MGKPICDGAGPAGWTGRELKTYTREELKHMIVQGDVLVLHHALVYRLNSWLHKHPGGDLAILHFVGRDATDEIEAYHPPSVVSRMKPFVIGRVSEGEWDGEEGGQGWKPLVPPIECGLWPIPPLLEEDSGYSSGDSAGALLDNRKAPGKGMRSRGVGSCAPPARKPASTSGTDKWAEKLPAGAPDLSRLALCDRLALLEPGPLSAEALASGYDVSPRRQHHLSLSYRRLHQRVIKGGYYNAPQPFYGYGPDLIRYTILFTVFFCNSVFYPFMKSALGFGGSWAEAKEAAGGIGVGRHLIGAVFLGLFWHQLTFVVHDGGHRGITGNWLVDRLVGIFLADFVGGLSVGWWCDNHDVHHLVTNHPEHDPDIQHLPFFAISPRFFGSMWSTYYNRIMAFDAPARFFVGLQHRLYYFVLMFGRFNLFVLSYTFLLFKAQPSKLRNLELMGIVSFWVWFGTLLYLLPSSGVRIMYVLVSFAVTSPLHVQIVLSHFASSTVDLGPAESFPHRQLRTTMDVSCPPYLDFLHGGLHMQVTHHLFPRIPRHNLRRASEEVARWCGEEGLELRSFKWVEGNRKVLGVLEEVARQVKVLGTVAEAHAKGELYH